jgi:hypothetical protein
MLTKHSRFGSAVTTFVHLAQVTAVAHHRSFAPELYALSCTILSCALTDLVHVAIACQQVCYATRQHKPDKVLDPRNSGRVL